MTNGNGDFQYWESDRTQPGGATESDIRPEQLEALQSYLSHRNKIGATFPPQPQQNFVPSPYQQVASEAHQQLQGHGSAIASEHPSPTISITTGKTRIDITITPL